MFRFVNTYFNCLFCANYYVRHFEEHREVENPVFDLKEFAVLASRRCISSYTQSKKLHQISGFVGIHEVEITDGQRLN